MAIQPFSLGIGAFLRQLANPAEMKNKWQHCMQAVIERTRSPSPVPHGLPAPLIVSLTSFPARFDTLSLTLHSLLAQTVAADRIILWIAHQDRAALPEDVTGLDQNGIEIRFCEDLRSFKKIIPTLELFPKTYIATADDDVYYHPWWLETLVCSAGSDIKSDIKCVVAHRVKRMLLDKTGQPLLPYNQWCIIEELREASPLNLPTGAGGILYPPDIFHADVMDQDRFQKLCPRGDDIWLYWMWLLNGATCRYSGSAESRDIVTWPYSQAHALWQDNKDSNDVMIQNMIRAYGFPVPAHA